MRHSDGCQSVTLAVGNHEYLFYRACVGPSAQDNGDDDTGLHAEMEHNRWRKCKHTAEGVSFFNANSFLCRHAGHLSLSYIALGWPRSISG
jgi:hypothetical protein